MTAANPALADRPETAAASEGERPAEMDVGTRDLRLGLIMLGVPAFIAVALGIILSVT